MNWGRIFNTQRFQDELEFRISEAKRVGVKEAREEAKEALAEEYRKLDFKLKEITREQDRLDELAHKLHEEKATIILDGVKEIFSGSGNHGYPFRRRF